MDLCIEFEVGLRTVRTLLEWDVVCLDDLRSLRYTPNA